MNKAELVSAVRTKNDLTWVEAHAVVDSVFDVITEALKVDFVSIPGFGKFSPRTRAARTMRNPLNGGTVDVPERKTVTFKAGKTLKNVVNS